MQYRKYKNRILAYVIILSLTGLFLGTGLVGRADALSVSTNTRHCVKNATACAGTGQVPFIRSFAASSQNEPDCVSEEVDQGNCKIIDYIVRFTRVMSGLVGVVIVIMITVGGVQFSMARDNPQAVTAARGRIINALLALVFYMFSFALLQWLIPGGIV